MADSIMLANFRSVPKVQKANVAHLPQTGQQDQGGMIPRQPAGVTALQTTFAHRVLSGLYPRKVHSVTLQQH